MTKTLIALFLLCTAGSALANDAASLRATGAWIRVMPANLPAGGYVTLENTGDTPVTLTAASSPAFAHAMIHRSSTEGGMGRMEMVHNVTLPPHASTAFAPGGYHVMLTEAVKPLSIGDKVPVTFTLGDGSSLPVEFIARPANATGPSD